MARKYDVVIFGATGFTGQLASEHLARKLKANGIAANRFALAGRNASKLEEVTTRIAKECDFAEFEKVGRLVGDANDEAFLSGMCREAKVVLTYAGPYLKYGLPLARCCVEEGTDYVDITGEATYQAELIKFHEKAKAKGVTLITSAGYDSIPFDVGCWKLVNHLRSMSGKEGTSSITVQAVTGPSKGSVSGGTIASAGSIVGAGPMSNWMLDPAAKEDNASAVSFPFRSRQFHPPSNTWLAPSVMEDVNAKVVYRTRGLLRESYGPAFSFQQFTGTDTKTKSVLASAAIGVINFVVGSNFMRNFMVSRGVLPKPGQGPSKEIRDTGYMNEYIFGKLKGSDGKVTSEGAVWVKGRGGDPGYKLTSAMSLHTALCLAEGKGMNMKGGVLTPASCLGDTLWNTMGENTGVSFHLFDKPSEVTVFSSK